MQAKARIVIIVEGGIVQDVLTEEPADVLVVDYDTEGAEPGEITKITDSGVDEAFVRGWNAEVNAELIEEINKHANAWFDKQ